MANAIAKSSLRRKGLLAIHFLVTVHHGGGSEQEPEGRNQICVHPGALVYCFASPGLFSLFSFGVQAICPGMVQALVGCTFLYQQSGRCPTDTPADKAVGSISSSEISSQICIGLCQIDKRMTDTQKAEFTCLSWKEKRQNYDEVESTKRSSQLSAFWWLSCLLPGFCLSSSSAPNTALASSSELYIRATLTRCASRYLICTRRLPSRKVELEFVR